MKVEIAPAAVTGKEISLDLDLRPRYARWGDGAKDAGSHGSGCVGLGGVEGDAKSVGVDGAVAEQINPELEM
jgi:hypothetical protein